MDPKELLNNPEQIKSLIGALQALLAQTPESIEEPTNDTNKNIHQNKPKSTKKINSNIKTKTRRRGKADDIENEFEKMAEFRMHKEDVQIDKVLSKHPPVARMRDFEPVEVSCRVCGKTEIVSPSLVFEGASRYKCNNCATQAG